MCEVVLPQSIVVWLFIILNVSSERSEKGPCGAGRNYQSA